MSVEPGKGVDGQVHRNSKMYRALHKELLGAAVEHEDKSTPDGVRRDFELVGVWRLGNPRSVRLKNSEPKVNLFNEGVCDVE